MNVKLLDQDTQTTIVHLYMLKSNPLLDNVIYIMDNLTHLYVFGLLDDTQTYTGWIQNTPSGEQTLDPLVVR